MDNSDRIRLCIHYVPKNFQSFNWHIVTMHEVFTLIDYRVHVALFSRFNLGKAVVLAFGFWLSFKFDFCISVYLLNNLCRSLQLSQWKSMDIVVKKVDQISWPQ